MAIRVEKNEWTDKAGRERFGVRIFHGRRSRPTYNYFMVSDEQRQQFIDKCIAGDEATTRARAEAERESKRRTREMRERVKVGDIFHHSWGYDQTQCDFYEVTAKTKSGATVTVREIGCRVVEGSEGMMCDRRVPAPGCFLDDSKPMQRRLTEYGIRMGHGCASLVKAGEDFYCSWYA